VTGGTLEVQLVLHMDST